MQSQSTELPQMGFIRQSELVPAIVPFSPATLWRKVKDGTFPAPVKLSERVTAWRVEDTLAGWTCATAPRSKTEKRHF